MLRYLFALIPGIFLFFGFYFGNSGEMNLLLRDFGRVSFFYLTLALAVTPIISLMKKEGFAPYRRVFGVLSFLFAIAHTALYFSTEYTYQKTFFVLAHFKELDVFSGVIAFIIIAILGITSNNYSVRLLKGTWKKIQVFAYPLFLIAALHVAFASRFEGFYITIISLLILLRTAAFLFESGKTPASKALSGNTTRYRCVPCGYIYDEKYGDPDGGIAPGTRFEDIPDDWICPVCGVGKADFVPYEEEYEKENTPATVVTATFLNPTTLELVLETEKPFKVIPGQYARIALKDRDGIFYRSYSVVDSNGKRIVFCIKISSGRGGNILKNIQTGDMLAIEGIYGSFVLQDSDHPKVFIATGTGLAPIMYMMRSVADIEKLLLFGVQDSASLFYTEDIKKIPKLASHIFLSREEIAGFRHGRIDLSGFAFPKESEFYICGNPAMVEDAVSTLQNQGFTKIYHEKF